MLFSVYEWKFKLCNTPASVELHLWMYCLNVSPHIFMFWMWITAFNLVISIVCIWEKKTPPPPPPLSCLPLSECLLCMHAHNTHAHAYTHTPICRNIQVDRQYYNGMGELECFKSKPLWNVRARTHACTHTHMRTTTTKWTKHIRNGSCWKLVPSTVKKTIVGFVVCVC